MRRLMNVSLRGLPTRGSYGKLPFVVRKGFKKHEGQPSRFKQKLVRYGFVLVVFGLAMLWVAYVISRSARFVEPTVPSVPISKVEEPKATEMPVVTVSGRTIAVEPLHSEPRFVFVIPTVPRRGIEPPYLYETLHSIQDDWRTMPAEFQEKHRVMVFSGLPNGVVNEQLLDNDEVFDRDIFEFIQSDSPQYLKPYFDPTPHKKGNKDGSCSPRHRRQIVTIANSLFSAHLQERSAHLVLMEDDAFLCNGTLATIESAVKELQSASSPWSIVRLGSGGLATIINNEIVLPLMQFVVANMYSSHIDTGMWVYSDSNRIPSYVSTTQLVKHIGVKGNFGGSWVAQQCAVPLEVYWGQYDICLPAYHSRLEAIVPDPLTDLGFNCTTRFLMPERVGAERVPLVEDDAESSNGDGESKEDDAGNT